MKDWDKIIDILPFIYKDNINEKALRETLDVNRDYELKHIDQLYMRGLLDRPDYIKYMEKLISRKREELRFLEYNLHKIKIDEDYSPLTHYCCSTDCCGVAYKILKDD